MFRAAYNRPFGVGVLGLALLAIMPIQAIAADKDCSKDVTTAFAEQRKVPKFRMKTTMLNAGGVLNMTVDYQLPGRMRQIVKRVTDPAASETVLVDGKAWSRKGGNWNEVPSDYVDQLLKQLDETVINPAKDESFYACAGNATIDGKEYRKFRGYETIRTPDKTTNKVKMKVVKRDDAPIRLIYLDAASGLPALNTVATAGRPDQPFVKTRFSYPSDIAIEPPTSGIVGKE